MAPSFKVLRFLALPVVLSIELAHGQSGQFPGRSLTPEEQQLRAGPWDQDVNVYRVATNGVAVHLGTFERAGVPTVTKFADGRLIAAHQYFPENNQADFDKVAVRFSSDEGRSWTPPAAIRIKGLPEGMRFPFDPTLVVLPDQSVRLYFTSLPGRRSDQATPAIYSAISTNGLDYTFEQGVRFAVEGRPVIDCAVALHQKVFHLYCPDNGAGRAPGGPPGQDRREPGDRPQAGVGYHAISTDGLHFARAADVRIEGRRQWLGNAQTDGREINFYGTGVDGVWTALSADGQTWSSLKTLTGLRAADPGAVTLADGSLLIIGTGPPRPGTPSALRRAPNGPPP